MQAVYQTDSVNEQSTLSWSFTHILQHLNELLIQPGVPIMGHGLDFDCSGYIVRAVVFRYSRYVLRDHFNPNSVLFDSNTDRLDLTGLAQWWVKPPSRIHPSNISHTAPYSLSDSAQSEECDMYSRRIVVMFITSGNASYAKTKNLGQPIVTIQFRLSRAAFRR